MLSLKLLLGEHTCEYVWRSTYLTNNWCGALRSPACIAKHIQNLAHHILKEHLYSHKEYWGSCLPPTAVLKVKRVVVVGDKVNWWLVEADNVMVGKDMDSWLADWWLIVAVGHMLNCWTDDLVDKEWCQLLTFEPLVFSALHQPWTLIVPVGHLLSWVGLVDLVRAPELKLGVQCQQMKLSAIRETGLSIKTSKTINYALYSPVVPLKTLLVLLQSVSVPLNQVF